MVTARDKGKIFGLGTDCVIVSSRHKGTECAITYPAQKGT